MQIEDFFYQLMLAGFNIRACVSTWSRWSRSQDQDQSGAKPGQACWWSYSNEHYFENDNDEMDRHSWKDDQQIPVCKSDSAAAKTNKELCKQRHLVQTLLNIAKCFISCEAYNWILNSLYSGRHAGRWQQSSLCQACTFDKNSLNKFWFGSIV